MQELLGLLKDGHARTVLMLASELHTTPEDIRRKLEYMEHMGIIRRISLTAASCGDSKGSSCGSCTGCSTGSKKKKNSCAGCIPGAELLNMGEMWEVVKQEKQEK